jgi:hypothetical protein
MKPLFLVGQTYSEVTPESAEQGDFSDTGWEQETSPDWKLADILRAIRDQGAEEIQAHGDSLTIYGWTSTVCYKTATEKQLCLHIEAKPQVIKRLKKLIEETTK